LVHFRSFRHRIFGHRFSPFPQNMRRPAPSGPGGGESAPRLKKRLEQAAVFQVRQHPRELHEPKGFVEFFAPLFAEKRAEGRAAAGWNRPPAASAKTPARAS
jgi:hypothetical protein